MHIFPADQLDADIDYFATDAEGHILHIASGGGRLPESVAASQEALLALHQHFLLRPETGAAQLADGADPAEASGAARYARRGMFSFAKIQLHAPTDSQYRLVARPAVPLTVAALPPELALLLRRTQLPGPVAELAQLDSTAIL
ncbi:hypothetical protein [Hymenobacter psychrophilus]|uniref:Uncharacterized protein n=1 Tax=Hymenobacter psychrophilus TaxID=651662 RepID=A0A1H3FLD5_9BACT|nr:hypothetical protein [Hymenobacter psychrophilus]SDX91923.1 hypothetical protein SAMN04488069_104137 [Hymenobacter psychrophilus]